MNRIDLTCNKKHSRIMYIKLIIFFNNYTSTASNIDQPSLKANKTFSLWLWVNYLL